MFNNTAIYQWDNPTALMLGEFNTFTNNDVNQVKNYIKDIGQVCIQVTNSSQEQLDFKERKGKIKDKLDQSGLSYNAKYIVLEVPNITTLSKS